MDELDRKDLDETRRLLYMAKAARHTDTYNLVGTLTNAMAHHGLGYDPEEVMIQVIDAIGEDGRDDWLDASVADITARLEAAQE